MLKRILSATLKQQMIACFVLLVCLGSYMATDVFLQLHNAGIPIGQASVAAAWFFAGPVVIGVFSFGNILTVHYATRRKDDNSLLISPWTSEEIKDVTRNFTEVEKRKHRRLAVAWGTWIGLVGGVLAISLILLLNDRSVFSAMRAILVMLLYFASLFWMIKRQFQFLSSTEYAEQKRAAPTDVR